jgi:hypothetical protein
MQVTVSSGCGKATQGHSSWEDKISFEEPLSQIICNLYRGDLPEKWDYAKLLSWALSFWEDRNSNQPIASTEGKYRNLTFKFYDVWTLEKSMKGQVFRIVLIQGSSNYHTFFPFAIFNESDAKSFIHYNYVLDKIEAAYKIKYNQFYLLKRQPKK